MRINAKWNQIFYLVLWHTHKEDFCPPVPPSETGISSLWWCEVNFFFRLLKLSCSIMSNGLSVLWLNTSHISFKTVPASGFQSKDLFARSCLMCNSCRPCLWWCHVCSSVPTRWQHKSIFLYFCVQFFYCSLFLCCGIQVVTDVCPNQKKKKFSCGPGSQHVSLDHCTAWGQREELQV